MPKPTQLSDQILNFYEQYDEANRLGTGVFQLEYARTQELLQRFLPGPPAVIYDVGGGPGVYACWLAQSGYEVHLLDPVPRHIGQAGVLAAQQPEHPIAGCTVGDARHLPFADESADVVLLLGPLYHLVERPDRIQALTEAHRVLKENGLLFAAAISRFASALDGLVNGLVADPAFRRIVAQDLRDGQHRNPTGDKRYFTESYFHRVEDFEWEMAEAGFEHDATVAIEGVGWLLQNFEEWWHDPERRELLLTVVRQLEREPALLGASAHLLGVARKKSWILLADGQ